ncbi:hypothetical protein ISN44_As06g016010 [Arabidopsis suecica]|uniref:Uncharacterized protein n=1 Tax=Arabidopsis suecica TaxID=45249 RepID=A0A8T2CCJ2_ARASU|nr:hypothetical protein ISN44_As06g016010 [Arabidopsis suecica]
MGTVSVAFVFLFLVFLCFPISLDSQKLDPATSLLNQEQAHEFTIKDIEGGEDDKTIDIFRAGKGGHGVTGGRGGGRKASPKKVMPPWTTRKRSSPLPPFSLLVV